MYWLFIWQCLVHFFPQKKFKYGIIYGTGMQPELTRGIRTFGRDLWVSDTLWSTALLIRDNFRWRNFHRQNPVLSKRYPNDYNFCTRVKDFTTVSHAELILQAKVLQTVRSLLTLFGKFSQTKCSHFKRNPRDRDFPMQILQRFQIGHVDLPCWPTEICFVLKLWKCLVSVRSLFRKPLYYKLVLSND